MFTFYYMIRSLSIKPRSSGIAFQTRYFIIYITIAIFITLHCHKKEMGQLGIKWESQTPNLWLYGDFKWKNVQEYALKVTKGIETKKKCKRERNWFFSHHNSSLGKLKFSLKIKVKIAKAQIQQNP